MEYFVCKLDFYLKKIASKLSSKSSYLLNNQSTSRKLIDNMADLDSSMATCSQANDELVGEPPREESNEAGSDTEASHGLNASMLANL